MEVKWNVQSKSRFISFAQMHYHWKIRSILFLHSMCTTDFFGVRFVVFYIIFAIFAIFASRLKIAKFCTHKIPGSCQTKP